MNAFSVSPRPGRLETVELDSSFFLSLFHNITTLQHVHIWMPPGAPTLEKVGERKKKVILRSQYVHTLFINGHMSSGIFFHPALAIIWLVEGQGKF